jgi:hypothetical protein
MRPTTTVTNRIAAAALFFAAPALAQPQVDPEQGAEDAPPVAPVVPDEAPAPAHEPGGPQLISTTTVTLAVTDPEAAATSILALSQRVGGQPPGRGASQIEVRVPRERMPEVLDQLRQLGTELARSGAVRDVSGELADLESRIRAAEETRERLLQLRAGGHSVDDSLLVEQQLSALDTALAELRFTLSTTRRQVELGTIHVGLVSDTPPPPEALPQLQLPFPWLQRTGLGALQSPPPAQEERHREVLDSMIDGGVQAELLTLDGLPGRADPSWAGVGAVRFRGLAPGWPLSLAVGFDAGLGGGTGFTYDLDLLIGAGSSVARWMGFGLLSGAAGRSWTGARVPAAWEVPAELFVTFELGDWGRLLLQARPQWIAPRIEARHDGSHLGFADELVLRSTLALAPALGHSYLDDGALRVGFAYHELRDTQMWTFVLGWGGGESDRTPVD